MASRNNSPKRTSSGLSAEQRKLRRNQIIFGALSVIILISMIISLVAK